MNLQEKRKQELKSQKEERQENIITAAMEVMKEKGISNSKMTDFAQKAEVAVVSIYRSFNTKPDLVIEAAKKFWEIEIALLTDRFASELYKCQRGIDEIKTQLYIFLELFTQHKDFLAFIEEFDNYSIKENLSLERLEGYEKNITKLNVIMCASLEKGKKDGSIRDDLDNTTFYQTSTHSLMCLCQKLALRGSILKCDFEISGEAQIKLLIDMTISYIKN